MGLIPTPISAQQRSNFKEKWGTIGAQPPGVPDTKLRWSRARKANCLASAVGVATGFNATAWNAGDIGMSSTEPQHPRSITLTLLWALVSELGYLKTVAIYYKLVWRADLVRAEPAGATFAQRTDDADSWLSRTCSSIAAVFHNVIARGRAESPREPCARDMGVAAVLHAMGPW
eukprot:gene16260-19295_t